MNTKLYLIVTALFFAFVGLAHLTRLVLGWSAQLGAWSVPLWMSMIAVVVCAVIAGWGLTLARRS